MYTDKAYKVNEKVLQDIASRFLVKNRVEMSNFKSNLEFINQYLSSIKFKNNTALSKESIKNQEDRIKVRVNQFKEFSSILLEFIENDPNYLFYEIDKKTIHSQTIIIINYINENAEDELSRVGFLKLVAKIDNLISLYKQLKYIKEKEDNWKEKTNELNKKLELAQKSVEDIQAAKLALEGYKTEEIYSEASKNYLEKARQYEILFYLLLFAAGCIAFISFRHFSYDHTNIVDFVLSKLMILTVVVTLGTIFLRKSSHLRKLHDQAHQTSLELQALPLFIKSLEKYDQDEIIKDLSKKYFGKELDQSQNDKIGDLIQDQMKASTDMVKASTEMVSKLTKAKLG